MTAEGKWRPDAEPTSERRKISPVVLDPQTLIRGNLAFRALDTRVLAGMTGANFDPNWYDTQRAEVIRVVDSDPSNQRGYYFMPYNGYHRIWAANTYIEHLTARATAGEITTEEANYQFRANDVTNTLTDRFSGQTVITSSGETAFTPAQALELVITPTEAHEDIASRRFAGHLLTEWENMVPSAISKRYSALAALTFLGRNELRDKPADKTAVYLGLAPEETEADIITETVSSGVIPEDDALHNLTTILDLADVIVGHKGIDEIYEREKTLVPLMAGITEDERPLLAQGLSEIAGVIRNSKRGYDDITLNAFKIVASLDTPESEDIKLRQMAGILTIPEIHEKIAAGARDGKVVAERQTELGLFLYEALPQAADSVREIRSFRQALIDPHLTYNNLVDVLRVPLGDYEPQAGEPDMRLISNRYDSVRKRINYQHLRALLPSDADDTTLRLARNLSTPKIMDDEQLAIVAEEIGIMESVMIRVTPLVNRLQTAARRTNQASQTRTLLTKFFDVIDHLQGNVKTLNALRRTRERILDLMDETEAALTPKATQPTDQTSPVSGGEVVFMRGPAERQIDEFMRSLSSLPRTPAVTAKVRELRRQLDSFIGVDWENVQVDPDKDGRDDWFIRRSRRGEPLKASDRHRVTLLIHRIASSEVQQIKSGAGEEGIMDALKDKDGNFGLGAVDNSLSDRLANLAGNLQWDRSTHEFRYLIINHYALSVKTRLEELEGKFITETLSEREQALLPFMQDLDTIFDRSVQEYRRKFLGSRTNNFFDILLYTLYTEPDSIANQSARAIMKRRESDYRIITDIAERLKTESQCATVVDLFKVAVLPKAA